MTVRTEVREPLGPFYATQVRPNVSTQVRPVMSFICRTILLNLFHISTMYIDA